MSVWFGGDYNPEQWPEQVWDEDVTLMQRAGVSIATVGVFSWARLEPREGEYDFGWLDRVIDKLHAAGVRVDLATATASPPPWLSHNYPEVLPVTAEGVRLWPGSRQAYCPSSPVYRHFAARLVTQLVERYGDHPAIEWWHVNNEYGCHVSGCYCDESAAAFRRWLADRYGTIEALNHAWGTAFWSQGYSDFAEVYPPRTTPTTKNPTQLLDYARFGSDELLDCFRMEAAIIRAGSPDVPLTTNFMGFFGPLDYWSWAPEMDFISDDSYPDPVDANSPATAAMIRDLARSLGRGTPWILMEQATSAVNWRERNAPKRAGMNRAWSYQSVARGADGILYFQWRQSSAGAEKFHSGMVPHAGTDSRVFREVEQLGGELGALDVADARVVSSVAFVLDWDSRWAVEQEAIPARTSYQGDLAEWYRPLFERNLTVDFVRATDDLSAYPVVIVSHLVVTTAEVQANLDSYVSGGGTLLATWQTGILDENLHVGAPGYLGGLQQTLGVFIEEFAPLAAPEGMPLTETIIVRGERFGDLVAGQWSEDLRATGAEVLARFTAGDLDGVPAITRNARGAGSAWYVATQPDAAGIAAIVDAVLADAGVSPEWPDAPLGVELVRRGDLLFVVNHSSEAVEVAVSGHEILSGRAVDSLRLEPQGVGIVRAVVAE